MSGWRRKRGGWAVIGVWILAGAWAGPAPAQMSESFEYGVPPPGWVKTNLLGGGGWYQLPIGTMPLPGWGNGTSSVPATANAGTHNAYCSWTTGGGDGEGYHSDQWLISPRLTGLTATSTVSYWLRFSFTNFPDTVYFRVSTNGPAPADFTYVAYTNIFARGSGTSQFAPWSNTVVNVGALGIPAGTPIWIAIQEYEWDNVHNAAAIQLDVIESDLTAPPEARTGPTSLVFTAYYEGADPAVQTFALLSVGSSGLGYSSSLAFGAGPTNWLAVGGPAAGTLGFQDSQIYTASVSVAGLDLGTYSATNVFTVPGSTNSPLRVPITLNVIRRPQTITFPNPGAQYTTNKVGLAGTASSGLPVTFSVFSGPGSITGATNLSFTGTGTVKVVAWQLGNVYYDVAPCVTQAMAVTKPNAVITITNLSHVYDGSPHGATVTTEPEGLTVDTTYNGDAALPVAIGSYAVTCTVNDVLYGGTATATYTITRMPQTVTFPDPGAQWTTSVVGLAATASSGLPVTFSVASGPGTIADGTNLSFTGAGTVSVVAEQAGDADWLPAAATNAIAVAKVEATVTLGSLSQTYDGAAKNATATTDPAGLTVAFTYDGAGAAPVNAGSYAVTGAINDAIYFGSDSGTLTIAKAAAAVTLTNLSQTYDGTPRNAAATTVPAGLTVVFTYDGDTNAPVAAGSYVVTGTVSDVNWEGTATGTLTIAKAAADVTLGSLRQYYNGQPKAATATTVPPGLAVDFTYDGIANPPTEVGTYAVTGTINDVNYAGSAAGLLTIEPRAVDLKINCGGPAIAGAVPWLADTGFVGGGVWTTAAVIVNTTSAPMAVYRSERSSAPLRYSLADIPDGAYQVTLHFSEMSAAGARGKRVSNVFIEGAQVLTNLDVFALTGGSLRALVRSFAVTVADGNGLQIELARVAGYPQLNGIEIASEGPPTPAIRTSTGAVTVPEEFTATFGVRLNVAPESDTTVTVVRASGDADLTVSGGANLVFTPANYAATQTVTLAAANDDDSTAGAAVIQCTASGYTAASVTATEADNDVPLFSLKVNCGGPALAGGWLADTGSLGGGVWATTSAVANATLAPMALYQRERSGSPLRYSLTSVPNGTYLVRLHFNDMSSPGGTGRRVCHVSLEGVQVEANLDIFAAAGGRMRALVRTYSVTVTGGNGLQIELTRVAGYPQLNGIEVSSGLGAAGPAPKRRATISMAAMPVTVLSSEDQQAPGAGWAAVDGDLDTVWQATGPQGSWICLGYEKPIQVRAVDVQFAAGSPLGLYTLASADADNWFELEPELEAGPVELNYLWFIFPPAPLEPPAAVREIEIQGGPGP